ncbi:MAG: hypothetical protein K2I22_06020 [Lachnospiraceae bacterium]|nr:hypothetical protein [Lachnospiraceae bacterium]
MGLLAIISGISTIASLLSIFFDVDKIHINLKKFVLLLSMVCLVIFSIASIINKKGSEDNTDDNSIGYSSDDSNSENLNNEEKKSSSNSEEVSDTYTGESVEPFEELVDGDKKSDSDKGILKIDPIMSNAYNAVAIEDSPFEIQPNEIIKFSGEVSSDGQSIDYEYIPSLSGIYRFEFSNVPNGTDLRLRIYNSGWEEMKSDYDLDNGDGLTENLTAGETYYIRVEQYRGCGVYTLNVGQKKETVDITNFTAVSDSIQYTNQENDYLYVAGNGGTYRFEFSNVPNGTDLRLRIYNSGWEEMKSDYDLDNGDGLTVSFAAGETYYIRVEQYREIGPYTLNIGPKKGIVDLTNYTSISDSIQYTAQTNDYSYVAGNDGTYRFEFSNVPNGTDLRLKIYNSGWEEMKSDYDLDNGDGLTVSFVAGETYYIRVEQYREYGSYTLNIGQKKEIVDITNNTAVFDSIQYTDQENDYLFTAKSEGTYIFIFSNVSAGNSFRLGVFNSGWEQLKSDYNLGNDRGVEVSLSAGESYFIRVTQYDGSGNYILTAERRYE